MFACGLLTLFLAATQSQSISHSLCKPKPSWKGLMGQWHLFPMSSLAVQPSLRQVSSSLQLCNALLLLVRLSPPLLSKSNAPTCLSQLQAASSMHSSLIADDIWPHDHLSSFDQGHHLIGDSLLDAHTGHMPFLFSKLPFTSVTATESFFHILPPYRIYCHHTAGFATPLHLLPP